MIQHQSGKLFFTSLAFSIFLHLSIIPVISFLHNNDNTGPDLQKVSLYRASLDYKIPEPVNNKKTLENERKRKLLPQKNHKKMTSSKKMRPVQKQDNQVLSAEDERQKDSDKILEKNNSSGEIPTGSPLNMDKLITGNENTSEDSKEENLKNILFKLLNRKIQNTILYPPAAKKRNIEGTVTVLFILDQQGYLLQKSIGKSSGYRILDKAAIALINRILHTEKEAVKLFSRFLPYPHTLDNRVEMKVAISYHLE